MIKQKYINHYATTFLRIAQERAAVEKFEKQLQNLAELLNKDVFLKESILDPIETLEHKKTLLMQALEGKDYDPMVINFIMVILEQHHERYLLYIIQDYQDLVNKNLNIVKGIVKTAVPLTEKAIVDLEEVFGKKLKRKVLLTQTVSPDLLGGLSVEIDGKIYEKTLLQSLAEGLVDLCEDPGRENWLKKHVNKIYSIKEKKFLKREKEVSVLKGTVYSVVDLDKDQRQALEGNLRKYFGREVLLEYRKDPGLIGGVLIRVRDMVIDGSICHRLNMLEEHLLKGIS